MQHQILFFDSAYLCPPPSQPLLRPQIALLPDDDFQLEDFHLSKTETMLPESPATSASFCGELEEELTIEEAMEEESSCHKRSLRDMQGFGTHRYAKSVLMKLESLDRRQLYPYPDPPSDATSDLLSLISRILAKFQKGHPRNSHPIVFDCSLHLITDSQTLHQTQSTVLLVRDIQLMNQCRQQTKVSQRLQNSGYIPEVLSTCYKQTNQ